MLPNWCHRDIGLSSKILRVSNSAFYNFPQQIGSINQAISMLGTNAVQSLVLSFCFWVSTRASAEIISISPNSGSARCRPPWPQNLSWNVCPKADTEEILVSGLLQNLGELILACTIPGEYEKVLVAEEQHPGDPCAAERSILGADHCYIGCRSRQALEFPPSIYLPILHHHNPLAYTGDDKKINLSTRAIYLSDLLLNIIHSEKPEYHRRFRAEARNYGLKPECIEEILDQAHIEFDEAATQFGLKMAETSHPENFAGGEYSPQPAEPRLRPDEQAAG